MNDEAKKAFDAEFTSEFVGGMKFHYQQASERALARAPLLLAEIDRLKARNEDLAEALQLVATYPEDDAGELRRIAHAALTKHKGDIHDD